MVVPKEGVIANIDSPSGTGRREEQEARLRVHQLPARAATNAHGLGVFLLPGRTDITDWPKGFAETQIVTAKQFDSVQLPDLDAIGNNRKDWTLKWQEIMG